MLIEFLVSRVSSFHNHLSILLRKITQLIILRSLSRHQSHLFQTGPDYNVIFAHTVLMCSLFIQMVTAPILKNFHFVCNGGISPKSECLKLAGMV